MKRQELVKRKRTKARNRRKDFVKKKNLVYLFCLQVMEYYQKIKNLKIKKMRKLASIQQIKEIKPIEGADRIEKIRINDWWCVSEKGNFNVGDLAVYFEIDALLPSSNPIFSFLAKGNSEKTMAVDGKEYKGYRLKSIKLRKQLSQGLALPLFSALGTTSGNLPIMEGTDVSELLGIVKYEAPISAQLADQIKGPFPSFITKTDEERVQNLGDLIKEKAGTFMYITEKLDGSSATYYKKDGVMCACSRNLELLDNEGNTIWKLARTYTMTENLPNNIAIQGEIVGEGIQKNPLKLHGQDFYVFNVFDIEKRKFYSLEETSMITSSAIREGIVIRPLKEEIVEIDGYPARFSFKAISNIFLLQEK